MYMRHHFDQNKCLNSVQFGVKIIDDHSTSYRPDTLLSQLPTTIVYPPPYCGRSRGLQPEDSRRPWRWHYLGETQVPLRVSVVHYPPRLIDTSELKDLQRVFTLKESPKERFNLRFRCLPILILKNMKYHCISSWWFSKVTKGWFSGPHQWVSTTLTDRTC